MNKQTLFEYLEKQNQPVSISEIIKDNACGKSEQEHMQISCMLQELKREGRVFRSVEKGYAYYSTDASKGEGSTGTQNFIDQLNSIFGQPEANLSDMEAELPDTSPVYWSFKQNLRMELDEFSLPLPDGFVIIPDEKRGCIAVEAGYEGDTESAPIQILPGKMLEANFGEEADLDLIKLFAQYQTYNTLLNMPQMNPFMKEEAYVKEFAYGAVGAMQTMNAFSYQILFIAHNGFRMLRIQTNDTPLSECQKELDAIIAWLEQAKPKKLPETICLDCLAYVRNQPKLLKVIDQIKQNLAACAVAYANIGIMEKRLTGEDFQPGEAEMIIKRQFSKAQRLAKTRIFEIDAALKAVQNPTEDLWKKAYEIIDSLFPLKIELDGEPVSIAVDSEIQACLNRWKNERPGKQAAAVQRAEEERRRKAEEVRCAEEERKRKAEEARRAEEERKRKADEAEKRRLEAERRRLEEERNKAALAAQRAIEEQRKKELAKQYKEEQKKKEEEKKRAAEELRRKEEEFRRAEEERKKKEEEERRQAAAKALWEAEEKRKAEEKQRKKKVARRIILFLLIVVFVCGAYVYLQYELNQLTYGYLTDWAGDYDSRYSKSTKTETLEKLLPCMSVRNMVDCFDKVPTRLVSYDRLEDFSKMLVRKNIQNSELKSKLLKLKLAVIEAEKASGDYTEWIPELVRMVLMNPAGSNYYSASREQLLFTQDDVNAACERFGGKNSLHIYDFYALLDAYHGAKDHMDYIQSAGIYNWPDVSVLFERGVVFPVDRILERAVENLNEMKLWEIGILLNRYALYDWKQYDENGSLEKILANLLEKYDVYFTKPNAGGYYDGKTNTSAYSDKGMTSTGIEYKRYRTQGESYYGDFWVSGFFETLPRTGNGADYILSEYDTHRLNVRRKDEMIMRYDMPEGKNIMNALTSAMAQSSYCIMQGEEDLECIFISDDCINIPDDSYCIDMRAGKYLQIRGDFSDLIDLYIEGEEEPLRSDEVISEEEVHTGDELLQESQAAEEDSQAAVQEEEPVPEAGNTTEATVEPIPEAGNITEATVEPIPEAVNTPEPTEEPRDMLEVYTDRETVKKVQQNLNDSGFNCGTPDGIAGKRTAAGITQYQTEKGLTVTGTVTYELLLSLGLKAE